MTSIKWCKIGNTFHRVADFRSLALPVGEVRYDRY